MAPYLTVDQLADMGVDVAGEPASKVERLVSRFEGIVERARGAANVPRSATFVSSPRSRRGYIDLPHVMVRLATVTINGTPVTGTIDIDHRRGRILMPAAGATVVYEHGLDEPTPGILDACADFVARELNVSRSGTSRDVLSQAFDGGTTRYSTPDWPAGRYTGYLGVDAAINAEPDYRIRLA